MLIGKNLANTRSLRLRDDLIGSQAFLALPARSAAAPRAAGTQDRSNRPADRTPGKNPGACALRIAKRGAGGPHADRAHTRRYQCPAKGASRATTGPADDSASKSSD